jgi:hypothetical protein
MSVAALVSPGTRLLAPEAKATKRPSPLRLGDAATKPCAGLPALSTLTRWIAPVSRFLT